jgi:hypothetical protein
LIYLLSPNVQELNLPLLCRFIVNRLVVRLTIIYKLAPSRIASGKNYPFPHCLEMESSDLPPVNGAPAHPNNV